MAMQGASRADKIAVLPPSAVLLPTAIRPFGGMSHGPTYAVP